MSPYFVPLTALPSLHSPFTPFPIPHSPFLVLATSIGRVPIKTQTFDRIRLCFRIKVRFSDAFLALHRINQRQRMQKI